MSSITLYHRKGETPHWQAQVYVGGRRYRFSCRTDHKPTAREYARQRLQDLRDRHHRGLTGLPDQVLLSEVVKRYEVEYAPRLRPASQERMRQVLEQALRWFGAHGGDPLVQHVTPGAIAAFLEHKRHAGAAARTVNLYRANLHRLFRLCVRPWQMIPTNPVAAVEPLRATPRETHTPTKAEYQRVLAECEPVPMLCLFVTLAWETGARSAELLQLEWSDVDFAERLLTFRNDPARQRHTKSHRSRTIPLSTAAVDALRAHAARFRLTAPLSNWVFKHTRRSRDAEPGQRIERVYRGFKAAAQRAGLSDLHPHSLRHAFATRRLAAGIPAHLVSGYLGHSDLTTVLRHYTHLVPEHLRGVVEVVDGEPLRGARDHVS